MLSIQKLSKSYRLGEYCVPALTDMSFELATGGIVCITGPSGSGKSTLLHCIGALEAPDHGKIMIGDIDIANLSERQLCRFRRHHIGYVFQSFNLQPVFTVFENVSLPLLLRKENSREEIVNKTNEMLSAVGLSEKANCYPDQLSGGQQQRVAIARALIGNPELVVADEPTASLDSHTTGEIMNLLTSLNQNLGTTIVIATHDPEVVRSVGSTIRLRDGRLDQETDASNMDPNEGLTSVIDDTKYPVSANR